MTYLSVIGTHSFLKVRNLELVKIEFCHPFLLDGHGTIVHLWPSIVSSPAHSAQYYDQTLRIQ